MGLTIHYTISGPARLKLTRVQRIVSALRKKAVALGFEHVTRLIRVEPDFPFAHWHPPGAKRARDLVPPSETRREKRVVKPVASGKAFDLGSIELREVSAV